MRYCQSVVAYCTCATIDSLFELMLIVQMEEMDVQSMAQV